MKIQDALKTIKARLEDSPQETILALNLSYYVILTVDIPKSEWKARYKDVLHGWNHRRCLKITEKEADEPDMYHRKLVGMLDQKEFDQLMDDFCLDLQETDTMGSVTELGWLPAMWASDLEGTDVYVTPFLPCQLDPEDGEDEPGLFGPDMDETMRNDLLEKLWEETKKLLLEVY